MPIRIEMQKIFFITFLLVSAQAQANGPAPNKLQSCLMKAAYAAGLFPGKKAKAAQEAAFAAERSRINSIVIVDPAKRNNFFIHINALNESERARFLDKLEKLDPGSNTYLADQSRLLDEIYKSAMPSLARGLPRTDLPLGELEDFKNFHLEVTLKKIKHSTLVESMISDLPESVRKEFTERVKIILEGLQDDLSKFPDAKRKYVLNDGVLTAAAAEETPMLTSYAQRYDQLIKDIRRAKKQKIVDAAAAMPATPLRAEQLSDFQGFLSETLANKKDPAAYFQDFLKSLPKENHEAFYERWKIIQRGLEAEVGHSNTIFMRQNGLWRASAPDNAVYAYSSRMDKLIKDMKVVKRDAALSRLRATEEAASKVPRTNRPYNELNDVIDLLAEYQRRGINPQTGIAVTERISLASPDLRSVFQKRWDDMNRRFRDQTEAYGNAPWATATPQQRGHQLEYYQKLDRLLKDMAAAKSKDSIRAQQLNHIKNTFTPDKLKNQLSAIVAEQRELGAAREMLSKMAADSKRRPPLAENIKHREQSIERQIKELGGQEFYEYLSRNPGAPFTGN